MDYQKRLTDLMNERNNIMAQIAQPLARLNQIDGQVAVLLELKNEEDAMKKDPQQAMANMSSAGPENGKEEMPNVAT